MLRAASARAPRSVVARGRPYLSAAQLLGWLVLVAACSSDKPKRTASDAAVRADSTRGGYNNPEPSAALDAGLSSAPDAFFIDDLPPPSCGEDGEMREAEPVGGTRDCPADKNREGCLCENPGERAACWPGARVNRNHGSCRDGVTRCEPGFEFGDRWGPCAGYRLPEDGATEGPEACRCFSNGTWALDNLVPCIAQDERDRYYIYSSHPDDETGYACNALTSSPAPKPDKNWTPSTLTVDCSGRFELCYTIKAGNVDRPRASDCILVRSCVNVWYSRPRSRQKLPDLPGWVAPDATCAERFVEQGGYGEMSVKGLSSECEPVDDGRGRPYVFRRASYCPPRCTDTPDEEACRQCSASGAGDF